jgi:hypothetical protein
MAKRDVEGLLELVLQAARERRASPANPDYVPPEPAPGRTERRDAYGDGKRYFHGRGKSGDSTYTDIDEFTGRRGVAGHFTENPEFANEFAGASKENLDDYIISEMEGATGLDRKAGAVYPVRLDIKNTFDPRKKEHWDSLDEYWATRKDHPLYAEKIEDLASGREAFLNSQMGDWGDLERVNQVIKDVGYDSYYDWENPVFHQPEPNGVAVFDSNKIRSEMANFDPAEADSGNILAGVIPITGGVLATGLATGSQDSEAGTIKNAQNTFNLVRDPRYFKGAVQFERSAANEGLALPDYLIEGKKPERNEVSIEDYVGRPFVTAYADRSRADGKLVSIDGKPLDVPVNFQGGQDFMYLHPNDGLVWASERRPTNAIIRRAQQLKKESGQDPVFVPWRMAPTGVDHATMTGEIFISLAQKLPKKRLKQLDEMIRSNMEGKTFRGIEDWPGMDNPEEAMRVWRSVSGPVRKSIQKKIFNTQMREDVGISQGQLRALLTQPEQRNAMDYGLQNVGVIESARGPQPSPHNTYNAGVPGQVEGTFKEKFLSLMDIFPSLAGEEAPFKKAEMAKEYATGTFTEDMVERMLKGNAAREAEALQRGKANPALLAGIAAAGGAALQSDDSEAAVVPSVLRSITNAVDTDGAVSAGRATMLGADGRTFADRGTETVSRIFDDLRSQKEQTGVSVFDETALGDVSGITARGATPIARYSVPEEYAGSLEQISRASPDLVEIRPDQRGASAFSNAITKAKDENKFGASVYVYPEDEYEGMRLFMTPDGDAGYALKPDGDVVSAFSGGANKGVANNLLLHSIEQGGKKLDAFDTVLPDLYSTMGFRESARIPWDDNEAPPDWDKELFGAFNNGEPDVSFMNYDRGPARPVEERMVDDYGLAAQMQEDAVRRSQGDFPQRDTEVAGTSVASTQGASAQDWDTSDIDIGDRKRAEMIPYAAAAALPMTQEDYRDQFGQYVKDQAKTAWEVGTAPIESIYRSIVGGGQMAVTGERNPIIDNPSIQLTPEQGDAVKRDLGPLINGIADGVNWLGDVGYGPVTSLLETEMMDGRQFGEQMMGRQQKLSDWWNGLTPETRNRVEGGAEALTILDVVAPAAAAAMTPRLLRRFSR